MEGLSIIGDGIEIRVADVPIYWTDLLGLVASEIGSKQIKLGISVDGQTVPITGQTDYDQVITLVAYERHVYLSIIKAIEDTKALQDTLYFSDIPLTESVNSETEQSSVEDDSVLEFCSPMGSVYYSAESA